MTGTPTNLSTTADFNVNYTDLKPNGHTAVPLPFDDRRLLPEGIHDATLDEIERELALSGRRTTLFGNLKDYVRNVRQTGWVCEVIIDGSFVMPAVNEPNDIDIILVLPESWDFDKRDFRPFEYNVLDRQHTKRVHRIEVYPVASRSERYRYFHNLFCDIRVEWCDQFGLPRGSRKGIVRITP